jgi:hypothetical protein
MAIYVNEHQPVELLDVDVDPTPPTVVTPKYVDGTRMKRVYSYYRQEETEIVIAENQ